MTDSSSKYIFQSVTQYHIGQFNLSGELNFKEESVTLEDKLKDFMTIVAVLHGAKTTNS